MPLFKISGQKAAQVGQADFPTEKALQLLVETNLEAIFNCRLVATEFSTGAVHAGRIDTLALSEDDNPAIIEYKKVVSSELVNQSLFYLAWLNDHKGDFALAAQAALGSKVAIDWSAIRVICIAPNYKKYDLHAVQVMGREIELWTYRRFANDTFYLEQILQGEDSGGVANAAGKNPVMVAAGKKAAETRRVGGWTVDGHLKGKSSNIGELFGAIREFALSLSSTVDEGPKKQYIAYRTTQNFVCVEIQRQKITLFLKLDPKKVPGPVGISRDVTDIGHFGTGDLEETLKTLDDFAAAKPFIQMAFDRLGG